MTAEDVLKEDFPILWNKLDMLDMRKEVVSAMIKYGSQFIFTTKPDGKEIIIINIIADYYKVSIEELKGRSRKQEAREARQLSMYFVRKITKLSSIATGRVFERSHATILHDCKVIENLCSTDKEFKAKFGEIETLLSSQIHL